MPNAHQLKKRIHPTFHRQNVPRRHMKGLADKWRKPRGVDNKQRMHLDYAGAIVDIGWRQPRAIRYMHPSGAYEILVHNAKEIEAIKHTTHVVRIAATVGAKKRATLRKLAAQKKLRVLN